MADEDTLKYNEDAWVSLRNRFLTSPMAGLDLRSLAENAGTQWTGPGANLTPEDFLDLDLRGLKRHPALITDDRVNKFLDILKETLAFDDPFSALIASPVEKKDDVMAERLERLGLPGDFPVQLMQISSQSRSICNSEQIRTLGEFLDFSGRMAKNIVIGDDFRALLNAVNSADESTIARYLPFRPGAKGVHVQEAVGLLSQKLEPKQFLHLVKLYGGSLNVREEEQAAQVAPGDVAALQDANQQYIERVIPHFGAEKVALEDAARNVRTLQDFLSVLKDDKKERLAYAELWRYYNGSYPKAKRGFFARLFGR